MTNFKKMCATKLILSGFVKGAEQSSSQLNEQRRISILALVQNSTEIEIKAPVPSLRAKSSSQLLCDVGDKGMFKNRVAPEQQAKMSIIG